MESAEERPAEDRDLGEPAIELHQGVTVRITGVVLLLIGAGIGVWGVGWYQSGSDCDPYYLAVDATDSDAAEGPPTAYENLTTEQQRAFRRTLATDDNYRGFPEPYFNRPTRVRYEGRTYLTQPIVSDGCQPILNFLARVLPLLVGGGAVLGGTGLLYRSRR